MSPRATTQTLCDLNTNIMKSNNNKASEDITVVIGIQRHTDGKIGVNIITLKGDGTKPKLSRSVHDTGLTYSDIGKTEIHVCSTCCQLRLSSADELCH
jgi:hypothetical protein